MTATLTFEIGRRPGITRRRPLARTPRVAMTPIQRSALSELVHGPGRDPGKSSRADSTRGGRSSDFLWAAVLALFFMLSGLALLEGARLVYAEDARPATRLATPHVDVTIARLRPSDGTLSAAAPAHSSPAASRTM